MICQCSRGARQHGGAARLAICAPALLSYPFPPPSPRRLGRSSDWGAYKQTPFSPGNYISFLGESPCHKTRRCTRGFQARLGATVASPWTAARACVSHRLHGVRTTGSRARFAMGGCGSQECRSPIFAFVPKRVSLVLHRRVPLVLQWWPWVAAGAMELKQGRARFRFPHSHLHQDDRAWAGQ